MIDCVICDLDGTLFNNRHRQHFMTGVKKDWDKFFRAMSADTIFPEVLFLLNAIRRGSPEVRIVLATGRPVQYLGETTQSLRNYKVPYDKLIMRKDTAPSDAVAKHDMLTTLRACDFNPILSIDDRPEVVDMWRQNGVPCIQCDASEWAIRDRGAHNGDPIKFLRLMAAVPGADPMFRVCIDELERVRSSS